VNPTFNVCDLIHFVGGIDDEADHTNLRTNHSWEKENDGRS